MLTLKLLRENPEFVISKLAVKNFDAREIVEKINALDQNSLIHAWLSRKRRLHRSEAL